MDYIRDIVHQYIQGTSTLREHFLDMMDQRVSQDVANKAIWFKYILRNDYFRQGYQQLVDSRVPSYYADEPYLELLAYLKKWGWIIFRRSLLQLFKNKLNHLLINEGYNKTTQLTVRSYLSKLDETFPKDISTGEYVKILYSKERGAIDGLSTKP